jgi:hypothetical protein
MSQLDSDGQPKQARTCKSTVRPKMAKQLEQNAMRDDWAGEALTGRGTQSD